jgi:tetratricopeptide (TPR) repeat protein
MPAMKHLYLVLLLLAALLQAQADGPDDQYVRIYNLIQQADTLENTGQTSQALDKYQDAQAGLQRFRTNYPEWNAKVVQFRLSYLATRIANLSAKVPLPSAAAPAPATPAAPVPAPAAPAPAKTETPVVSPPKPPPAEFELQLNALREQTRQLQADKGLLEAKLKEALAAQPAATDPQTVAALQDKLKTLTKENDLLKVALAKANNKPSAVPAAAADSPALQQAQQALMDANRKLAEQTERSQKLAAENASLHSQLSNRNTAPAGKPASDAVKKELAEANKRLKEQTELAVRLDLEKQALLTRMQTLAKEQEAATALRAENELLKKQVASLKAPPAPGKTVEPKQSLAEAQAQIAALQSDKELLRLEKIALESRLKQVTGGSAAPTASATATQPGSAPRGSSDELSALKARLQVLEARAVPYSAEELALFKKPDTRLATATSAAGKPATRELPAGTAKLAAEAQRYFANRQLDKAEEKYQQILKKDQNNSSVLANLAAIQLEQNHLEEAEKNLKQALTAAPEDAYALSVFGFLRFRQQKYDDALDYLSRAAQINPDDAELQNFLGLTLSHKGQRVPAETALRKAVQLAPGYGGAHVNLAVIYATQQPPLVELARWHYQKALSTGHARNPDLEKILEPKKNGDVGR